MLSANEIEQLKPIFTVNEVNDFCQGWKVTINGNKPLTANQQTLLTKALASNSTLRRLFIQFRDEVDMGKPNTLQAITEALQNSTIKLEALEIENSPSDNHSLTLLSQIIRQSAGAVKELYLKEGQLSDTSLLADSIKQCHELIFFYLVRTKLLDNGHSILFEALHPAAANNQLNHIALYGQALSTPASLAALIQLIDKKPEDYQSLSFYNCDIGAIEIAQLAEAVKHKAKLTSILSIQDNKLSQESLNALAAIVPKIDSLILARNDISAIPETLTQALCNHGNLKAFRIDQNQIDDQAEQALAKIIQHNCSLRSLSLDGNLLNGAGAKALLRNVSQHIGLEELWLSNNKLTHDELAELVKLNKIKTLILSSNQLTTLPENFVSAMCNNADIMSLNLENNELSDNVVPSLLAILNSCHNLINLGLSAIPISDQAWETIIEALPEKVWRLDIKQTRIAEKGLTKLVTKLQAGCFPNLSELGISDEPIYRPWIEQIRQLRPKLRIDSWKGYIASWRIKAPALTQSQATTADKSILTVAKTTSSQNQANPPSALNPYDLTEFFTIQEQIMTSESNVNTPTASNEASTSQATEAASTSGNTPELKQVPFEYVCLSTGQILYAPVMTGYGITFEQEAGKGGFSNWNLKLAILHFLETNPHFWPAVYVPKALREPLAKAQADKCLAPLASFLQQERKQIKDQLAEVPDLKILEQMKSKLSLAPLNYVLHKLGDEFIQQALPLAEQCHLLKLAGDGYDEAGADLVAKHLHWQQAKYYAALCHFIQSQDTSLVRICLKLMNEQQKKWVLNAPPAGQPYPLHVAVLSLNLDLIKLLLEAGADITKADSQGNTAVHQCAVQADSPTLREIIKYLVKQELVTQKADTTKTNSAGKTAYQIASSQMLAGYIEKLYLKPNHSDVFYYQKQERVELKQKNQALSQNNEALRQKNEALQAKNQALEEQIKLLQQKKQTQATAAKPTFLDYTSSKSLAKTASQRSVAQHKSTPNSVSSEAQAIKKRVITEESPLPTQPVASSSKHYGAGKQHTMFASQQLIADYLETNKPPVPSIVPTLGDGSCTFNACALGICQLVENKQLSTDDGAVFLFEALKTKLDLQTATLAAFDAWLAENLDSVTRQKSIAPVLRKLAIDYIENNYQALDFASLYREALKATFTGYMAAGIVDETFMSHEYIKKQFDEIKGTVLANLTQLDNEEQVKKLQEAENTLLIWWEKKGCKSYFGTLRQSGMARKYWGSELELNAIATLLGINIVCHTNHSKHVVGIGAGWIRNLTQDEIKQLSDLEVGKPYLRGFRLEPGFTNQEQLIKQLTHLPPDITNEVREQVKLAMDNHNRKFDSNAFTPEQIALLLKRHIIQKQQNSYIFVGEDNGIDSIAIQQRLQGVGDELSHRIVESYNFNVPELHVNYSLNHWSFITMQPVLSSDEETSQQGIKVGLGV